MDNGMINCSDMISKVLNMTNLGDNEIDSVWKSVVSKINNYESSDDCERKMPIGERLAGNTRVVDLKKGILLVETDHSGWIQYLKMYQKFIITGLKRALPDLKINTMAFRITGSNVSLSDSYNESYSREIKKMSENLDKQDKEIEKFFENNNTDSNKNNKKTDDSSNLPPELLEKFESIMQSMLTNPEK
ncbi:MAG: DUF721 domain-containing protein [Treponema sp.]|nr:DUF721 domain-containing protein [Treponema sp.]